MKKMILTLVVALMTVGAFAQEIVSEKLLDAIAMQESKNNPNAKGDKRKGKYMAIGAYQLWDIYVQDVNRFAKTTYTSADRWNPEISREIVRKYLTHYGKRYERLTGKKATDEVLARIHNGGPNGFEKSATDKYWNEIQRYLK